CARSYDYW
nr:immunoglobulin heavy chain junction region [Mus musculus]